MDDLSGGGDTNSDLLSFVAIIENDIPFVEPPEAGSIWANLMKAIEKEVKKDGIRKSAILPDETEDDVVQDAVTNIYYDVAEFYAWYFNKDDDRTNFISKQKKGVIPSALRAVVLPTVDDNLDAMREVDEIPSGQDTAGLDAVVADNLSRYIVNWQDWYYDRKIEDAIDNYDEQASIYDDIYEDSDYGDLNNLLDDGQFDGVTDVPYIGNPPA